METLSEREQKLLDIVKLLLNVITVDSMSYNKIREIMSWEVEAIKKMGLGTEWQEATLGFLVKEYGVSFTKIDENGNPLEAQ